MEESKQIRLYRKTMQDVDKLMGRSPRDYSEESVKKEMQSCSQAFQNLARQHIIDYKASFATMEYSPKKIINLLTRL